MHHLSADGSGQTDAGGGTGLSRREVVGCAATGLALAMFARTYRQVEAQEATPAAAGGMPLGLMVAEAVRATPAS